MDFFDIYRRYLAGGQCPTRADLPIEHDDPISPVLSEEATERRDEWIAAFGFAVPFSETLAALLPHGPFLEVGAGSGFFSEMLAQVYIEVVATDKWMDDNRYPFVIGRYGDVKRMGALKAVATYPRRTILMSWPSMRTPWACRLVNALPIGAKIVLVSEGPNGCIGTPGLHKAIHFDFELVERIPLARFKGLNDRCNVYVKRKHRGR